MTIPPTPRHSFLRPTDSFLRRHIGPTTDEVAAMLSTLGFDSLDALVDTAVPAAIRTQRPLGIEAPRSEHELLRQLRQTMGQNQVLRSYIGLGYHDCITPGVIQRNILENPGWYTQYTPYQAEISQGRLEMLFNFQTMISDLCALPVANASLLDEATAAAEAMAMCLRVKPRASKAHRFFVSDLCLPQTIAVVQGRADALGIELTIGEHSKVELDGTYFGCLLQYPSTDGAVLDYEPFCERAHQHGALVVVAADLLALAILRPPGEFGADACVGSSQRFGVPLGFGGPHAAFLATREAFKRQIPGRMIGLSMDRTGRPALRMALQTREQHIRRDRATSNICTAQVLLAVIAGAFGVYHGPEGLRAIAERILSLTELLRGALLRLGHHVASGPVFDTLSVRVRDGDTSGLLARALDRGINLRLAAGDTIGIALNGTVEATDLADLLEVFGAPDGGGLIAEFQAADRPALPETHRRSSPYMTHPTFHAYRSETEMLRYLRRLEAKDLSLTTSMIPLGSCTMKLNGTTEMQPVTWPEIGGLHPFVPRAQTGGYRALFAQLESWLGDISGFDAVSLQPNAGSQGEYAGLLVIRAHHRACGEGHRNVCLIPTSAHGTNPASAVMAGMKVVAVACDADGNIDIGDLESKASKHADNLAALMVTYPSTHGVFEAGIREITSIVHAHGGQVYMDGANMNALVGLCRPAELGADVCHLNLHKTFCIPHGGGGPGMGPICVKAHLQPYLPGHPLVDVGGEQAIAPVAAAPWGSPSILPISWIYIALMGPEGLTEATRVAVLSANYVAKRLEAHYPILYKGQGGLVAHECIIDLRPLKASSGVQVDDVAKRLMDYGFHAPTMSWPVAGTMMIEPTESENKAELDRFCDAMIAIREEAQEVADGAADPQDNLLKNAPHTAGEVAHDGWSHPYTRERAAFPAPWTREHKYWPPVSRVDNAYGDRNLVCTCPPVDAFTEE